MMEDIEETPPVVVEEEEALPIASEEDEDEEEEEEAPVEVEAEATPPPPPQPPIVLDEIEPPQRPSSSGRRSSLTPPRRRGGRGRSMDSFGASSVYSNVSMATLNVTNSGSNNPITNDVKLNILVHDKLENIKKYKQFHRWKSKFLDKFDSYLSESGIDPARKASAEILQHLESCSKRAATLLTHLEKGDMNPTTGRVTVRAALALKEFCVKIDECRFELEELVPAKQIDERRRRYTKFHVGAALIKAGFPQYVAMKELEELVQSIMSKTVDVERDYDILDKQERDLFNAYRTQVSRFCDVMADLDLYVIMLKCVEFLNAPDYESDDDVEELTIFVKRYMRPQNAKDTDTTSTIPESWSNGTNGSLDDDDFSFHNGRNSLPSSVHAPPPVPEKTVRVDVDDCETVATVASMVADELGFKLKPLDKTDITEQLTIRHGNDTVVRTPKTSTLKSLNIDNGDVLTMEQAMIEIKVRLEQHDGKPVELTVTMDPNASLGQLKAMLEQQQNARKDLEGIPASDQRLFFNEFEMTDNDKSLADYGIVAGSVLDMDAPELPVEEEEEEEEEEETRICIVDTKYGTMFAVPREEAIEKGVVTPKIVNQDDVFLEATEKQFDKERMHKAMMSSPNLKVKPQIVIQKMKIEDYEIDGADDVKNMWGVSLKKAGRKKRSTEIFFVDLMTKAVGFLDRKKLLDTGFITVVKAIDPSVLGDNKKDSNEETLEQAEKDQQTYDMFVYEIRKIFGIAFEQSLGLQSCLSD